MAAAILANRLDSARFPLRARSAGLRATGGPADDLVEKVLTGRGFDYRSHDSVRATNEVIDRAALVLVMERAHLLEIATTVPDSFAKTFGLTEIVALGNRHGARRKDEPLDQWLSRLCLDRSPATALRGRAEFDVEDPHAGPLSGYERCADQLTRLIDELVILLGAAGVSAPPR